ncbi:MAG: hypothetical protein ACOC22_02780 [bacterium]
MDNKVFNNNFRFNLYQEDVLLYERCFDADQYNPFTRYSIDIRGLLPKAITTMQKVLSKKNYCTSFEPEKDGESFDFYQYNQKLIKSYPHYQRGEMYYNPKSVTQHIGEMTIKGVYCKMGFYINDKTIVEREFYVDGFNPVSRWSVDLVQTCEYISNLILEKIKESDVNNMWDDYDLINKYNFSINYVRELSDYKRKELLRKIKHN